MPIPIIVTHPAAPWPVGTRLRGHIGDRRAVILDGDRLSTVPASWVAPAPPPADRVAPVVARAIRASLPIVAGGLLSGCLRASGVSYEAGLVDGAACAAAGIATLALIMSWARSIVHRRRVARWQAEHIEIMRDRHYAGRASLARHLRR